MLHAVFFLVGTCQLMLLDGTQLIVLHTCCHHESVLGASLHGLRVEIVARLLVLHKPAFTLELLKLLDCNVIDTRIMLVDDWVEVDFRLDDMIKRLLVSLAFSKCFL